MKRLHRSTSEKMVAGVAGGMGEYFDIDPTILRVIFALVIVFTGIFPGLLIYIILAIIVPKEGEVKQ